MIHGEIRHADLPGFALVRAWAADVELADLLEVVTWEQREFTMYGRTIRTPRLTAWYGEGAYTYSGQRHEPATMPAIVAEFRDRASRRRRARRTTPSSRTCTATARTRSRGTPTTSPSSAPSP